MIYAYNAIEHRATGYPQFYLVLGRDAHLPIDFLLAGNEPKEASGNEIEQVTEHTRRLQEAFAIMQK